MGRIRKTLAWTLSPGGNMHGLVRAESSAERAAREAAEQRAAAAREQTGLLKEQIQLLQREFPAEREPAQSQGELPLRLACGHVAFVANPHVGDFLPPDGMRAYYCRKCESDQVIAATGPDAMRPPPPR